MDVLANLGIDVTSVVIYLINFGILLAVVMYFVTGPVLRIIDERQQSIKDNLEEAERIKDDFMKEKAKADRDKEALKAEMAQEMENLKKELQDRRREQEEALQAKKAKMLEEVRGIVEAEKKSILKKAEQQTLSLIEKVVLHVVSNSIPADVVKGSVEEAWKSYSK